MRRWFVQDRNGREIYLTEEQWGHITSRHFELRNHLEDVLDTIRRGRRQQNPRDPQLYIYRLPCSTLRPPFTGILVLIAFRFDQDEHGGMITNNFVITAWGIIMRR